MQWAAILLILALMSVLYQLFLAMFKKDDYISRMNRFTGQQVEVQRDDKPKKQEYRRGVGMLARGIERSGMMGKYRVNTRKMLLKANVLMKSEEFISIQLLSMFAGAIIGFLMFSNPVISIITALVGLGIPTNVIKSRIKKRLKIINNQLGDTIAILSNSLKAGHSFFQSVDSVAREMTGPVAEEFTKLQKEISLGVNTETALENMVTRVGSDDLELMVTAVMIQRQIGGNLAEILDNISSTIRQRIKTKGEIKALTAQGRMSGWIISLLPFVLAGFMLMISPSTFEPMVTEPLGIIMIIVALLMEGIGIYLVNKIVNIEV